MCVCMYVYKHILTFGVPIHTVQSAVVHLKYNLQTFIKLY